MSEERLYGGIVTDIGEQKIAQAFGRGEKLPPTVFVVGDGGGEEYRPTGDMTQLRNEVWRGEVDSVTVEGNVVTIAALIPSTVGGFTMREVGIYDGEGDFIAVGNMPSTPKVVLEDGAPSEFVPRLQIAVDNADVLEIVIGSILGATKKDLENHNNDPNAHHANNAQQELCTLQHNLGRFPGCDAAYLEYAAGIAPAGEGYPGGTDPVTFRPEVKHHSRNALTVLVPQKYAREVAAVNQLRDNEYAVIYKEGIESLLILLR